MPANPTPPAKDAVKSTATREADLPVIGMYCANCARAVERALTRKTDGVDEAEVNVATDRVRVRYDPAQTSLDDMADAVRRAGYRLVLPAEGEGDDADQAEEKARAAEVARQRRALAVGIGFTIPLFLLSMGRDWGWVPASFANTLAYDILLFVLAVPVQFYTGRDYYTGSWHALRNRAANMDVLVALGSTTAFVYSVAVLIAGGGHLYFETAAMIITLIKVGKWLEARAKGEAGHAIRELLNRVPATAHVLGDDNETEDLPVGAVRPGDRVLVRQGETIPLDGLVERGESSVDASLLTGESAPVDVKPGESVFGGTINQVGSLVIVVSRPGSDSAVARIVQRVKAAQGSKAPIQRLADRVSAVFVPVIVAVALITFALWWMIGGAFEPALVRLVAVLVIACPCALGLATPTAIMTGMGAGAKAGILFRDAEAVEIGANVRLVAFDKTGTLTRGRPELADIVPAEGMNKTTLLQFAASAQRNSAHPLAGASLRAASDRGISLLDTAMFNEEAGSGVRAMLDNGRLIRVAKPTAFDEVPEELAAAVGSLRARGMTVSLIGDRYKVLGALGYMDMPREEATEAVSRLRAMGLHTTLLSGDHGSVAVTVGKALGVHEARGDLLPEQKEAAVIAYRRQVHGGVAVVGDGINDAPALARADLGIAVGGGADVAIEAAAVTLPGDDLRGVPRALQLSRATVIVIRQNLFWAFFYNILLVPVAAGLLAPIAAMPPGVQQLHPALAAAAMAFSSVTVVLNSLRLGRVKLDA